MKIGDVIKCMSHADDDENDSHLGSAVHHYMTKVRMCAHGAIEKKATLDSDRVVAAS